MTIVGGFDVHRQQITFDYVDTDSGRETDTKLHQRRHVALDPVTIAVLTNYQQ